jgi:hypothetical protein
MWLVNLNIRVKYHPKGWTVEVRKTNWRGKKYWIHIISYSGLEKQPYYYQSKDDAIKAACEYFHYDLLISLR